eukprot:GSMAST32.ASY1.ANO1.2683.1 assembled CDS
MHYVQIFAILFAFIPGGLSKCSAGYYLVDGVVEAKKNKCALCPSGRYGDYSGATTSDCSGLCSRGHYCPPGSTSNKEKQCPAGTYVFCPEGSGSPRHVDTGYYTIPLISASSTTRQAQKQCEPGWYCKNGIKNPCPPGVYGRNAGLSTKECSGPCPAGTGFYCPFGSKSAKERQCGRSDVFCPKGSSQPTPVSLGYYTLPLEGEDGNFPETTRSHQLPCPPGSYCVRGLKILCPSGTYSTQSKTSDPEKTCEGNCSEGYYCPTGSITSTAKQCGGISVYCPAASPKPIKVSIGFYTTKGGKNTRSSQVICPPGSYCVGGERIQCPPGTYGSTEGLTNNKCTGPCAAGYYCPEGSSSSFRECGGERYFCPHGSGSRQDVTSGHYSFGGTTLTRHGQRLCIAGADSEHSCPSTTISEIEKSPSNHLESNTAWRTSTR